MYFSKELTQNRHSFVALVISGVIFFMASINVHAANTETAIFAGGCFWCMEPPFRKMPGVISVTSGYTGGHIANPTYEQVSAGSTGHVEAVQVIYDPKIVTYKELLSTYWHNIDPTAEDRQFCDVGEQYRSVIFVTNAEQRKAAEDFKQELIASGKFPKVYTAIEEATVFYLAEDYHQDFANKNPIRYEFYRFSCGREQQLKDLWGE